MQVTITPIGRMSFPADIRKRLGLTGGRAPLIEETPDGEILRTVAQSIAHAHAPLAKKQLRQKIKVSLIIHQKVSVM